MAQTITDQKNKIEIIIPPDMKKIDTFMKKGVQGENKIEAQTRIILKETGKVQKVDKFSEGRTKGYLNRIKDHLKEIERTRKAIKDPVLKMGESIDSQAKIYKKELEKKAGEFKKELNDYKAAEEKRKQAEFDRIEGLAYKVRQATTIHELQENMKNLAAPDRTKKRVVEAFNYTKEKIDEAVKIEKMKAEQKLLQEKKEKAENLEVDKLQLMRTLEELQHFEDYVENMYEITPEKIQREIDKKRESLQKQDIKQPETPPKTTRKTPVAHFNTGSQIKPPKDIEKSNQDEIKQEKQTVADCLESHYNSAASEEKLEDILSNPNYFLQKDLAAFIVEIYSKGIIPETYFRK